MENNQQNEIILYQPNETVRLEVRLEDETVWLTQQQIAALFATSRTNIVEHIKNIYAEHELEESATCQNFRQVRIEGGRRIARTLPSYNLDMILSVGYRVKSTLATRFRQWATSVLKEHMLRGFTVNARLNQMEDRIDRRLAQHDAAIADLREQVDFFIKTNEQPVQGVFYDGQLWDACSFVEKLIAKAKKTILLIDKEIYLIGASLKDLGKKCFGFTRIDAGEIPGIKARVG